METTFNTEAPIFHPDRVYSAEEYLLQESASVEKHEFRNGKVTQMSGANPTHNLIAANVITQLNLALQDRPEPFFVLTSDTKIHIPRFRSFVYPDAVVVCREIELYPGSTTVITNPLLVVEVLSPSTQRYDQQGKFHEYKQVPSFREYVLVEQRSPFVLASFLSAERTWTDTQAEGLSGTIELRSLGCVLALERIYRGVRF